MEKTVKSKITSVAMIVLGLIMLWFDYLQYNYTWGILGFPFDALFAVVCVGIILAGIIKFFTSWIPQQSYTGLRMCGSLIFLVGLAVVVFAFWDAWLVQEQISKARTEGRQVTGGWGWIILLLYGVLNMIAGIGSLRLKKVAIYSIVPLSAIGILVNVKNLYMANPFAMIICLFFGIVIYFAVSYLIKIKHSQ